VQPPAPVRQQDKDGGQREDDFKPAHPRPAWKEQLLGRGDRRRHRGQDEDRGADAQKHGLMPQRQQVGPRQVGQIPRGERPRDGGVQARPRGGRAQCGHPPRDVVVQPHGVETAAIEQVEVVEGVPRDAVAAFLM